MNLSYEWLRTFVPFNQTAAELRELLTAHVATVDEIVALRDDLAAFVVARVVEEAPHPDSDHLHVTRVDAGTGTLLDVVCGAPNVAAGKMYPFAPTGTLMPSGLKIQKRRIRGAISDGMLCSARELGLGDEQDGILELSIDVPPGTPLLRALPLGDVRLVVDVGANRPDLLSHLGVAREIAGITGKPFAVPAIDGLSAVPTPTPGDSAGRAGPIDVRIDEPGLVNRFMGVVVRRVRVGPSPDWLVQRLAAVGVRSINNVVDASNYVLHELGQPTHAFDLARLVGSTIVVRRARAGERITTLDGVDRALGQGDQPIVIADAERPLAVAGVMGGRDSEVSEATTDLFIEVANFDAPRIRAARRALGLSTDASYRFERGVDIEIAPRALERVAQLVVHLAGGQVDGTPVDLCYSPAANPAIPLRTHRVAKVLGDAVGVDAIAALLSSIGFGVDRAGADLRVTVPSWRSDVRAEVDLIEEVARLRGYDSFPVELRPFRPGTVPDAPLWETTQRVTTALVAEGLLEVRPLPFVVGGAGYARVVNPLAENEAYLRRSVLETLARRAEYNLARMQGDIRLFEVGSVFEPRSAALPHEELRVGALIMGRREPRHFTDPKSEDFDAWVSYGEWDAKALGLSAARSAFPGSAIDAVPSEREGVLWELTVGGNPAGEICRIALDAPVWAAPAYGVELSLGELVSAPVAPPGSSAYGAVERRPPHVSRYQPLPTTPASELDLALQVPEAVQAQQVESVIRRVSGRLLEKLELFDRYVGHGVEPGYRSLAWRLTFRHAERTLRDREIDARRSDILRALADELHVRQRSA